MSKGKDSGTGKILMFNNLLIFMYDIMLFGIFMMILMYNIKDYSNICPKGVGL